MVRIRLTRKGKKRFPMYRVVVADIKFKRDGRFIENIGHYNPHSDPPSVTIKEDRALHWLSVGAQPSDAVRQMLEKQGTYDRLKRLHAGEELEALVAEYSGVSLEEAVEEAAEEVEEAVEEAAEAVEEAAEEVAEAAEEAVEEAAEAVEEAAEEVAETVEEAVEDAADDEAAA